MSYNHLKLKLGVSLTGYTVAMVIYQVEKMAVTCLPMFRHLFDAIIVVSTDKEWCGSVDGKCWKLVPAVI